MVRQEGPPQPIKPEDSIWNNPLTRIQIEYRDGRGYRGPVREPEGSVFPAKLSPEEHAEVMRELGRIGHGEPKMTDQELSDWLMKMNEGVNERIERALDDL